MNKNCPILMSISNSIRLSASIYFNLISAIFCSIPTKLKCLRQQKRD